MGVRCRDGGFEGVRCREGGFEGCGFEGCGFEGVWGGLRSDPRPRYHVACRNLRCGLRVALIPSIVHVCPALQSPVI